MYVSTASVCTVGLHVPGPNVSRRSSMGIYMGIEIWAYGHVWACMGMHGQVRFVRDI